MLLPSHSYADSLREHNDELMWFFELVDFLGPSVYIDGPGGDNASWPHRSDFVRATMRECERISNLTGGKPILPQVR